MRSLTDTQPYRKILLAFGRSTTGRLLPKLDRTVRAVIEFRYSDIGKW